MPTMIKRIEVGMFGFAEAHPVYYLTIDLFLFIAAATFCALHSISPPLPLVRVTTQ